MRKFTNVVWLSMIIAFCFSMDLYAEDCTRGDKGISQKEWVDGVREGTARIYPSVEDGDCGSWWRDILPGTEDKVLVYDISPWIDALGKDFDADLIVVYADLEGRSALESLQKTYTDTGNKIINNLGDYYCSGDVRVCVGSRVDATDDELRGIFLWYKGFEIAQEETPVEPETENGEQSSIADDASDDSGIYNDYYYTDYDPEPTTPDSDPDLHISRFHWRWRL